MPAAKRPLPRERFNTCSPSWVSRLMARALPDGEACVGRSHASRACRWERRKGARACSVIVPDQEGNGALTLVAPSSSSRVHSNSASVPAIGGKGCWTIIHWALSHARAAKTLQGPRVERAAEGPPGTDGFEQHERSAMKLAQEREFDAARPERTDGAWGISQKGGRTQFNATQASVWSELYHVQGDWHFFDKPSRCPKRFPAMPGAGCRMAAGRSRRCSRVRCARVLSTKARQILHRAQAAGIREGGAGTDSGPGSHGWVVFPGGRSGV